MQTIDRREFIRRGAAAAGVATLGGALTQGCATAARPPASERPNLVFVFGDQWRRHALGFMNEDPVLTPQVDRFAQDSLVFTNALSCCPICSPYRASLITGRYPMSTGVFTNNILLPPDETSIADVLKGAGYATGYIGKWHLDGAPWNHFTPPGPRRQGFDFWYSNGCYHQHFKLMYWRDAPEPIEGAGWQPDHETDVAIDFIRNRDKDRPFALFVSWAPPHTIHGGPKFYPRNGDQFQYAAPDRFEALYRGKKLPRRPNVPDNISAEDLPGYFGAVTSLDENFGRLLQCLDEQGLADNTIIALSSDHGEMMGSHGRMTKCTWHEESVGIPFLIRWPDHVKRGREDMLFNTVDVMPSLLGLMGQPIPASVEGTDYSAAMRGEPCERPDSAFIAFYGGDAQNPNVGWRGIRTPRHTVVEQRHQDLRYATLYDNVADPYQMNERHARRGEDAEMDLLWERLDEWLPRAHDPWAQV